MNWNQENGQRMFVPFFALVLAVEFLAGVALASGDEVWSTLCMLWWGPVDDIAYGLLGAYAGLYLLDPGGKNTHDPHETYSSARIWRFLTSDVAVIRRFSERLLWGGRASLGILALLLFALVFLKGIFATPVLEGAHLMIVRYLVYLVPVMTACAVLLALLRVKGADLRFASILVIAEISLLASVSQDGRWHNHFFHLFANLENLQAWLVAVTWAGFMAALREGPKQDETSEGER